MSILREDVRAAQAFGDTETTMPTPGLPPTNAHPEKDRGWALSPLDGRYRAQTHRLANYLSEDAINRLRIYIEVEWLVFISANDLVDGLPPLSAEDIAYLRSLPADFTDDRRARLAALEAQTRHDVKAVEYLVREHILAHSSMRSTPLTLPPSTATRRPSTCCVHLKTSTTSQWPWGSAVPSRTCGYLPHRVW